jgi:hypothetical protein
MHTQLLHAPSLSARGEMMPPFGVRTGSEFQLSFHPGQNVISRANPEIAGFITLPASTPTIEEKLFDATANAKIWTSRVAVHLGKEARDRFFRQLDWLHDPEEWSGNDQPVNIESYKGLIRAVLHYKINERPALALMPNGNLLAIWQEGKMKVSVEFLLNDRVRWFAQHEIESDIERASGLCHLTRIREVLAPYSGERWFHAG